MAEKSVHHLQAKHNEEVAKRLIKRPPSHDWGITAAFYSAIHYFETWLYDQAEKHTETSIPTKIDGSWQHTPHAWREKLIEKKLTQNAFTAFRKLKDASETARYLSLFRVSGFRPRGWITRPAPQFFVPQKARHLVEGSLKKLKKELNL